MLLLLGCLVMLVMAATLNLDPVQQFLCLPISKGSGGNIPELFVKAACVH